MEQARLRKQNTCSPAASEAEIPGGFPALESVSLLSLFSLGPPCSDLWNLMARRCSVCQSSRGWWQLKESGRELPFCKICLPDALIEKWGRMHSVSWSAGGHSPHPLIWPEDGLSCRKTRMASKNEEHWIISRSITAV